MEQFPLMLWIRAQPAASGIDSVRSCDRSDSWWNARVPEHFYADCFLEDSVHRMRDFENEVVQLEHELRTARSESNAGDLEMVEHLEQSCIFLAGEDHDDLENIHEARIALHTALEAACVSMLRCIDLPFVLVSSRR